MIDITEIINLAIKSIKRNKSRSMLTALGIIIGVAAVILLVSLGQGLQDYITGQFENLGANQVYVLPGQVGGNGEGISFGQGPPNFAGSKLTLKQVEDIAKLDGPIKTAATENDMPATVSYRGESKYTTVAGISSEWSNMVNIQVGKGRGITTSDVELGRKVAILGTSMVEDLFGRSDPIGKEVNIADNKFEVIGVIKEIGAQSIGFDIDNFVAIPITTSQVIFGQDSVQTIMVQAINQNEIEATKDEVERYLLTQMDEDEFTVVDSSSLLDTINSILGVLTAALGGIAAISLVVGGVGIMNIMLVSVTERTREIGLRKAVGAKQSDILTQFIIEAVTLSLFGGLVGILIGWGGSLAINQFFPASVTPWSVMLAFGVSAAVGIIFGVAPAIRASRLDPIDALRYE
jgi:ABC-type antimicrobial peptide transport system permease subunit